MKKFKSGDIVEIGNSRWMYACIHPIETDHSMVIDPVTYNAELFKTDELSLIPKTHTVNGFEVPATISEAEFEGAEDTDRIYSFSSNCKLGYHGMLKCHISIVAVKCGFVFKTESDIRKNIAALQGIDPCTVGTVE